MKYAIVTGGSRGLGARIVTALIEHKVVDQVAAISRTLAPPPARFESLVHGFSANVTDEKQIRDALEAIASKLGPNPSVLCNNAGGGERAMLDHSLGSQWEPVEVFRDYVDLNLNSVHIVTREVAPRMLAGAVICNITSVAGLMASPLLVAYGAAKAGVISYTRSCALRLAADGIRVNAVAPGVIYTPLWEDIGAELGGTDDQARATFEAVVQDYVPLGREQTVEDIGHAVAWLCSEQAYNVTGQVIAVDGGSGLGFRPTRYN